MCDGSRPVSSRVPTNRPAQTPLRRCRSEFGFSEYALHAFATQANTSWIADHLDANTAQTLASRAYHAANRMCVGKARRVRRREQRTRALKPGGQDQYAGDPLRAPATKGKATRAGSSGGKSGSARASTGQILWSCMVCGTVSNMSGSGVAPPPAHAPKGPTGMAIAPTPNWPWKGSPIRNRSTLLGKGRWDWTWDLPPLDRKSTRL